MNPKEVLTQARSLIAQPDRWITGTFARDAQGNLMARGYGSNSFPRGPLEEGGVKFCALGAIWQVTGVCPYTAALEAKSHPSACAAEILGLTADPRARETPNPRGERSEVVAAAAKFNNSHSHGEVLDLFDRAIASIEEA